MRKIKWMGLLLVLTLLLGMISGCSPVEKDFFNLMSEEANLRVFQESGSVEINISELPDEIFTEADGLNQESLQQALNRHRLDFIFAVDYEKGIMDYNLTIVDKSTEEKIAAVSAIYKDNILYIKIDELLPFLKEFADEAEKQNIDKVFAGVTYISLSSQELQSMLNVDSAAAPEDFLKTSTKQQQMYLDLIKTLMNNVYNNYEGSFISKNGKQYTITLRGDSIFETCQEMAVYSINNIDKLGSSLNSFVAGMSQSNLDMMGFTDVSKEELQDGINEMVQDVNLNRETYLAEIEKNSAQAETDLSNLFSDSEITCTYEKLNKQTYENTMKLRLHIINEDIQEIDCTLNVQEIIKTGISRDISAPTENLINFQELQQRMPKVLTVWIDDNYYYLEQGWGNEDFGDINVNLIDSQVYLPMRTVFEMMGDQVGWDEAAQQAYVERDSQRFGLNGRIIDGMTYVNRMELEKLGYVISWDDWDRSVMIEKR